MSQPYTVADIMTRRVVCLLEEENLESVEKGMQRFGYRHLPVVDGSKIVGLVSEADFLRASVSSLDEERVLKDATLKRYYFVSEIMTRDVVTVRPDCSVVQAAQVLRERRLGCLPVTEADGSLVGIVTSSDFVALAARLLEAPAQVA